MSSIFLSYANDDGLQAVALRDWLNANGWDDVVLDPAPEPGAQPGDRARSTGRAYAGRCGGVVFLVSRNWLASQDCRDAYELARRLNKAVFVAPIENLPLDESLVQLQRSGRLVSLVSDENPQDADVAKCAGPEGRQAVFPVEGLEKLKAGLAEMAADAESFDWPPPAEPERAPYRGLEALETMDAGVFFGREEPLIEALDAIRGLAEALSPRLFVVLGMSGAGKSSFLRAGLWPRLERDKGHYLPLPVIRPGRAAINGGEGLVAALGRAAERANVETSASKIREALADGPDALRSLLEDFARRAAVGSKLPTLVVAIDRAEELFRAEGAGESESLLQALRNLVTCDDPAVLVIFAMRSDSYDDLAGAKPLDGLRRLLFPLGPLPQEGLRAVIERPAQRVAQAGGALEIDPDLTQALLEDVEERHDDALPLLAFALEQLYRACGATKRIARADYESFGGLPGAIDAALARVFEAADRDSRIPKEKEARLALLRGALVPVLAHVDPATRTARRRIASAERIPQDARPLIDLLVDQHLLARKLDVATAETTFELAHEALLRRWETLKNWLDEESERFALLDGVRRASRRWDAHSRLGVFAAHNGVLLEEARRLYARPDFTALLDATDRAYLAACFDETRRTREEEEAVKRTQLERAQKEQDRLTRRVRNARLGALASSLAVAGALALAALAGWRWLEAARDESQARTRHEHLEKTTAQLAGAANGLALNLAERLKDIPFAPAAVKADILSKARKLQEQAIASGAAGDELRRSESVLLNEIAQARLASGDFAGALDAARQSTTLMEALSSARPADAAWRRDLSVSYEKLGDVQRAMGDLSGALKSYRDDLAIAEALSNFEAGKPQWRWDLSISLEKIGDVQRAQNDLDGALSSYRKAVEIREKVSSANPDNAAWRRDLAVTRERIGALLARQGDAKSAIAAFQQALAIYQALVRADPNDAQSLAYSVVPHWRLSELDRSKEREHLESALGILRALAAKDLLDAKRQAWLSQIEAQLSALDRSSPATRPTAEPTDHSAGGPDER